MGTDYYGYFQKKQDTAVFNVDIKYLEGHINNNIEFYSSIIHDKLLELNFTVFSGMRKAHRNRPQINSYYILEKYKDNINEIACRDKDFEAKLKANMSSMSEIPILLGDYNKYLKFTYQPKNILYKDYIHWVASKCDNFFEFVDYIETKYKEIQEGNISLDLNWLSIELLFGDKYTNGIIDKELLTKDNFIDFDLTLDSSRYYYTDDNNYTDEDCTEFIEVNNLYNQLIPQFEDTFRRLRYRNTDGKPKDYLIRCEFIELLYDAKIDKFNANSFVNDCLNGSFFVLDEANINYLLTLLNDSKLSLEITGRDFPSMLGDNDGNNRLNNWKTFLDFLLGNLDFSKYYYVVEVG